MLADGNYCSLKSRITYPLCDDVHSDLEEKEEEEEGEEEGRNIVHKGGMLPTRPYLIRQISSTPTTSGGCYALYLRPSFPLANPIL